MVGFFEECPAAELARLGAAKGVPLFDDLGSGCFIDTAALGLPRERTVPEAVRDGAGLVAFSGDKLLGGPQAGILVGRRDLIDRMRKHPLHRALRIDKFTAAALEMTLRLYRDGRESEIPAVAMLAQGDGELKRRAESLRQALASRGVTAELLATSGQVGGGALPLAEPPSWAVALAPADGPQDLSSRLRRGDLVVAARIADERLLLDMRAVRDNEIEALAASVAEAWEPQALASGEAGHA